MSFGNHVAYVDLDIFKGNKLYETGKLSIKVYQKLENRYMYPIFKRTSKTYKKKLCLGGVKMIHQDKYRRTQFP